MRKKYKVFFNASVILSAFHSGKGGSSKLLDFVKEKRISGIISEVVLDEVLRNIDKTPIKREVAEVTITELFIIVQAPHQKDFSVFKKTVLDEDDIHLFVSANNVRADFLVSLDKRHVLSLKKRIKDFKIVSPKELIEKLS